MSSKTVDTGRVEPHEYGFYRSSRNQPRHQRASSDLDIVPTEINVVNDRSAIEHA